MSKKISKEIAQGIITSRMTEKKVDRSIRSLQKSQKKLLYEIKGLLDSNNADDARLLAVELAQSRTSIKQLGKLKFYCRGIQFFFKNAQMQMIKGETMDQIAHVLTKVNKMMSIESLDRTFLAVEDQMETLNLNLEQTDDALESLDEPIDNDEYADQVLSELKSVKPDEVSTKINELVSISKLLPSIPTFDKELRDETDDLEFEDQ